VAILEKANKTWAIHVGLSSRVDNELEIIQYSTNYLQIQSRLNQTLPSCPNNTNSTFHPDLPGIMYIDTRPTACSDCCGQTLLNQYGNLTGEYLL